MVVQGTVSVTGTCTVVVSPQGSEPVAVAVAEPVRVLEPVSMVPVAVPGVLVPVADPGSVAVPEALPVCAPDVEAGDETDVPPPPLVVAIELAEDAVEGAEIVEDCVALVEVAAHSTSLNAAAPSARLFKMGAEIWPAMPFSASGTLETRASEKAWESVCCSTSCG